MTLRVTTALIKTAALSTALLLSACSPSSEKKPPALNLTNDQLASVLGIKSSENLQFGEIISDSEGVEIASLSFKTQDGQTVSLTDLDVDISVSEDYLYTIPKLTLAEMIGQDTAKGYNIKVTNLIVTEPDPSFLLAIQNAITKTDNTKKFSINDLKFNALAIETIAVSTQDENGQPQTLSIKDLNIIGAGDTVIESLAIGSAISQADNFSLDSLLVKQLDRTLVDALLSQYVSPDLMDGSGTPVDEAGIAFDHLSVTHFATEDFAMGPLQVDIKRAENGEISHINIPPSRVMLRLEDNVFASILKATTDNVGEALIATLSLDYATSEESGNVVRDATMEVAGLGRIDFSGQLNGLDPVVEDLLLRRDFRKPHISAKTFDFKYTDNGLIEGFLAKAPFLNKLTLGTALAVLLETNEDLDSDTRIEKIKTFLDKPGTVTIKLDGSDYHNFEDLISEFFVATDDFSMTVDIEAQTAKPSPTPK